MRRREATRASGTESDGNFQHESDAAKDKSRKGQRRKAGRGTHRQAQEARRGAAHGRIAASSYTTSSSYFSGPFFVATPITEWNPSGGCVSVSMFRSLLKTLPLATLQSSIERLCVPGGRACISRGGYSCDLEACSAK